MIRLSVTDLDSYLYWRDSEDMTFEQLLTRLRGQEPPNANMLAGRAFHSMLEKAGEDELYCAVQDGFEFVFDLDSVISVPPIRELKGEVVINTHVGPVTLVGKVDTLNGLRVSDYKLTERFDAECYADSYQWRCYLEMFGATEFIYEVFQYRWDLKACDRLIVYDHQQFRCDAYPGMRADIVRQVSGLAEIVAKHVPEKINRQPEATAA